MKTITPVSILRAAFAGGLLSLAIGSCGRAEDGDELQIDSNTNWLIRCESDDQCSGSLRCYCGQCTQPCASNDECGLLAGAECAATDGPVCSGQPAALGGLCVLGCSGDLECGRDFTCTDNQCVPKPCSNRYQDWDSVLGMVAADLNSLDSDDTQFIRYISVANHAAYAACDGALTLERQAIDKLLNSLSNAATLTRATPIDVDETLYRIDIRNYGWDHEIRVGDITYSNAWQALVGNNPFAVQFSGDDAYAAVAATGDNVPVMFADSLTAAAVLPEVYVAILGIPQDERVLFVQLGIDRSFIPAPRSLRAGYESSPSITNAPLQSELIATHWELGVSGGYLWEIAVVGPPEGSLFDDPLQRPSGERALIFTLPNGLQAFAFMNGDSRWLSDPVNFYDSNVPTLRATAPVSLLREHSARVNVRDDVLEFVQRNPDRYAPEARAAIAQLYISGADLDALLDEEADTFVRRALADLQLWTQGPEPISATFDAYSRRLSLEQVAGEMMVPPEALEENLPLLDPAFDVLRVGTMTRDDFALHFRQALCTLSAVSENPPSPSICPTP